MRPYAARQGKFSEFPARSLRKLPILRKNFNVPAATYSYYNQQKHNYSTKSVKNPQLSMEYGRSVNMCSTISRDWEEFRSKLPF